MRRKNWKWEWNFQTLSKAETVKLNNKTLCIQFKKPNHGKPLWHLIVCERKGSWLCNCLPSCWAVVGMRSSVTGKFCTSCLQTSQTLLPLLLNHSIAQSLWTSLRAPLQLHSILRVFSSSHGSRQILQTASSSGISSSSFSKVTEPFWSDTWNKVT